jgi:xanthine dehydrogenase large subunit
MYSAGNVYDIEQFTSRGFLCKTNIQSSTAFRGFGSPQGMLIIEQMVDNLAYELKVDKHLVII